MTKRILFVEGNTDGTIGGSYYSLLFLVEGVVRSGVEAHVAFHFDHALRERFEAAGARVHLVDPERPVHLAWLQTPFVRRRRWAALPLLLVQRSRNFIRFLRTARGRTRYLRRHRFDLVHLNNSVTSNHLWMIAARLAGMRCVTHERGINQQFSRMSRLLAPRLDAIVCISTAVRDNMIARGVARDNLVVVPNALDPDRIRPSRSAEEVRRAIGIPDGRRVIGLIGNIRRWKGQDVLVRALPAILARIPDVHCMFAGAAAEKDQPFADRLRALVRELHLEDRVTFAGFFANVADALNVMEVAIHASTEPEPFGRVLLEAMAMRKPVVGSADGAVPEIVVDGRTGYLFPPGDADALAAKVIALLEEPGRSAAFGEAGYARLVSEFGMEGNVSAVLRLYDRLLPDRPTAGPLAGQAVRQGAAQSR